MSIEAIARKHEPEVFLIGATTLGRDLAGAIATSLGTGLTADCTKLEMGEVKGASPEAAPGDPPGVRRKYHGRLSSADAIGPRCPVCGPGCSLPRAYAEARGEIVEETSRSPRKVRRACVLEFIHGKEDTVDIEYSDVIVSGGRGLGGP